MPWVLRVAIRGAVKRRGSGPVSRSVRVSPSAWPPFISTHAGPMARSASPCAAVSVASCATIRSRSRAASGRFGVSTLAMGRSRSIIAAMAGASISRSPDLAIITGSRTMGAAQPSSASATASVASAVPSIPILTAATSRSSSTAAICARIIADDTPSIRVTARVFWAVTAVRALAP